MPNSKFILLIGFLFIFSTAYTQIINPVKWKQEIKKINDDEFEVHLIAEIDEGWKLFSEKKIENFPPTFNYEIQETFNVTVTEKMTSNEETYVYFDTLLDQEVEVYIETVSFIMKVKLTDSTKDGEVRLAYEYIARNDVRFIHPVYVETNFILLP